MFAIRKRQFRETFSSKKTWVCFVLGWIFLSTLLPHAHAQSEQTESEQTQQRRPSQVLSNAGYRKMSGAREALEAEDHSTAITLLKDVIEGGRYSVYDKAKALQMRAFIYLSNDEYPQAIAANRRALGLQALDAASELELMYTLANLYAYTEQYELAIQYLEQWFRQTEEPDAQAHFTAAQVYALAERLDQALQFAERGMVLHKRDAQPRESWYRLLLAIRLQLKKYTEGSQLLEEMLELWPGTAEYYMQLSALYRELGREHDALVVLSIAHRNHLLDKSTQLEQLAQMYRYHDYPHKGAVMLDRLLGDNEPADSDDGDQWKNLGDAYAQSREWRPAKNAYLKAARLSSTGDNWLLLCQTAYRDGLWGEAKQYCQNALEKGGLEDDQGYAWQIVAMAHYHKQNRASAMDAFRQCSAWPQVEEACSGWLDHMEKEIQREKTEREREATQSARAAEEQTRMQEAVQNALGAP